MIVKIFCSRIFYFSKKYMSTPTRLIVTIIIANNMNTLDNIFFSVPDSIFRKNKKGKKITTKKMKCSKKNIKTFAIFFLLFVCDTLVMLTPITLYAFDVISVNFPFLFIGPNSVSFNKKCLRQQQQQ